MEFRRMHPSLLIAILAFSVSANASDLDIEVIQSFVVGDGTVAGATTDFVVDLGQSPDPSVAGLGLTANSRVTLVLAPGFTNQGTKQFLRPIVDAPCVPFPAQTTDPLDCNTLAFVQGWPQAPVPPGLFDNISYDAARNAVIATVGSTDIVPFTAPVGPGIKSLHAILNGFTNPRKPGKYPITVEIDLEGDGSVEHSATANVHIIPRARRAIGVMSFCADDVPSPPNLNTIYQSSGPSTETLPYDLVLWDKDAAPLNGVDVWQVSNDLALLRRGNRTVGHIIIDAPAGAHGMMLWNDNPSGSPLCGPFLDRAPLTGVPAAFLRVRFITGNASGLYTLNFSINGGNEFKTFVLGN